MILGIIVDALTTSVQGRTENRAKSTILYLAIYIYKNSSEFVSLCCSALKIQFSADWIVGLCFSATEERNSI